MSTIEKLERGWVLVSASKTGTANEILNLRDSWVLSNKKYYVVRADEVAVDWPGEFKINIIVPVFAVEGYLGEAVEEISRLAGVDFIALAFVTGHHPARPHETWGYIPSGETNPKPDAGPLAWNGWG